MFKKPVKVGAQNQLSGKDKKIIKTKLFNFLDNQCVQKILSQNEKIICCKISGSKMLIYNGQDYPLFVDGTGNHNYFPSLYAAIAYQPLIKTLIINEGVQNYIYNGANLMWPGVRNFEGLGNFNKDQTVGIRNSKGQVIAIGAMGCSKKDLTDTSGVAVYILHYFGDKLWQMGSKNLPQIIVPMKEEPKKQEIKQQVKTQEPNQPKQQEKKVEEAKDIKEKQGKSDKQGKQSKQGNKKKEKSPETKKKSQKSQQSSQDDEDFMSLVHPKNQPKGKTVKMQPKANIKNAFIEDENQVKNIKSKKKGGHEEKGKQKGGKHKKEDDSNDEDKMQQQEVQQKKGKKDKKDDKKKAEKKVKDQKKPTKKQEKSQDDQEQQTKKQTEKTKQNQSDQQQKQTKDQQKSVINSKIMDQYFKQSMLNAIKLSKIQAQLPVDSGKFYMDYMLPARPEGVKLDIKESSYKKIGKFFEQMAKKKLIQYKHPKDKKAQGAMINKIFWENQQLKNHVPTVKKLASKQEEQKVQTYSKAKLKLSKTVSLQTVFKPSQQLIDNVLKIQQKQGLQKLDQYISQKDLKERIQKYINFIVEGSKQKQKQVVKKVQKTILVDYSKHEFLKLLLKKQIEEYEQNKEKQQMLKAEQNSDEQGDKKKKKNKKGGAKQCLKIQRHFLVQKLMKKASPFYHLYDKDSDLDRFKQGTFKGIQLTAEKVNNKNVTRIVGLEVFIIPKNQADDQINGFANTLQLKFACSVNVQNLPGKNAGKEIIAHGTFLDQLQEIFTQEYQLPDNFITILNKLDKKKKN